LNIQDETIKGSESVERQIINSLIQKILGVTYFRDTEIPDCPKMGGSELFNFTDDNIPKIENTKLEDEKPSSDFDIDNLSNIKITPEILTLLNKKIQNKEFTQEQSNKILAILQSHLNNTTKPSPNPNQPLVMPSNTSQVQPTNNPVNNPYFNPPMNMNPYYNFNSGNMPSMPGMSLINPLNNNLTNSNLNPLLDPKRLIGKDLLTLESKMNMNKYKTKPCRNYHGPNGCMRGSNCHFIHDTNYAGVDIPNFNLANYNKEDQDEKKPQMPMMIRPQMPMMPINPMGAPVRPPYGFMAPNFPYYMNPNFMRPPTNKPQEDNK
jgi:predicted XRE-type DNA-binding protein